MLALAVLAAGALDQLTAQTTTSMRAFSTEFDSRVANVQRSFDERIAQLHVQWQEQNRGVGDRLRESAEAMRSVSESLGRLAESSKKIEEQAANVLRLEDLLKP